MSDDWPLFKPPGENKLARHAHDLAHRAQLVRRYGWGQYRHLWSCGEVIGTALVLGDDAELQRCGETTNSALERWAFDLWGMTGGEADADAGLLCTRAWFDSFLANFPPKAR